MTFAVILFFLAVSQTSIDSYGMDIDPKYNLRMVQNCPTTEASWNTRKGEYSCNKNSAYVYHCLLHKNETKFEFCAIPKKFSHLAGCPVINFLGQEVSFDSHNSACPSENSMCPKNTSIYNSGEMYQFPACLCEEQLRQVQKNCYNGHKKSNGSEDQSLDVIIPTIIMVIIFIILLVVILSYLMYRRKKNRNSCPWNGYNDEMHRSHFDVELSTSSFIHHTQDVVTNDHQKVKVGSILVLPSTCPLESHMKVEWKKDGKIFKEDKRAYRFRKGTEHILLIMDVVKSDAGIYTCTSGQTECNVIVEDADRAIYHDECWQSLISVPSILCHVQQATQILWGLNSNSSVPDFVTFKRKLMQVKDKTFNVLSNSYRNTKKIEFLASKIKSLHIENIIKVFCTDVKDPKILRTELNEMLKAINEGKSVSENSLQIIEETVSYISSVTENLEETIWKQDSASDDDRRSCSKELEGCRLHLRKLQPEWTEFKDFFESIDFVIKQGIPITEQQVNISCNECDVKLLSHLVFNLRRYVMSIQRCTQCYVNTYKAHLKGLVSNFYSESMTTEDANSVLESVKNEYKSMLESNTTQ